MKRYLLRAVGAELRTGRGLLVLSVLGVALGVGSVLSIRILDQGALGAFAGTVRAVSGEAPLTVIGNGPSFPEALYPAILSQPGVAGAVPATRIEAAVEGGPPLFREPQPEPVPPDLVRAELDQENRGGSAPSYWEGAVRVLETGGAAAGEGSVAHSGYGEGNRPPL